ncbi:hypothetical protein SE18_23700 [Herpetosiphon geysericola]|uniref:Type I restriction modification DNA specificity domain-containing protein n=2 Tax=Herpetosiphon geysericola TaxID=70996 RepID=A0A0P6XD19_9CHLR|nr:hypothetical protein SE18_23700 [Herpetosiphon geysericola]
MLNPTTESGTDAVPAGYKRTEVGIIPEDWPVVQLGDLATFITGPFGSAIHKSDYIDYGIPLINPMHIIEGSIVPSSNMSISSEAAKNLVSFHLRFGDVIIGRRGDMGRCAVVQKENVGWICGTGSLIIRCFKDVSPSFIQRILSSPQAIAAIEDTSVGSTMINLNQNTLKLLSIQYPPYQEQRAIAEALSDTDALITALDRLIAKKRAIKQATMQQLLTGKTRLPGFDGEWHTKHLGDILSIKKGQLITESSISHGSIPVVAGGKKPAYFHNRANRFGKTITISASGANAGYIHFYDIPIYASDCLTISEGVSYCLEFIYYQLLNQQQIIYDSQTGGAQPHIYSGHLSSLTFVLPLLDEQRAIATVLSDMDAELYALEQRRAKTIQIKQGMMQQLLTGRIRLRAPLAEEDA